MMNREEIRKISMQSGLTLYQQEKEYLLKLFLYLYYKKYKEAVFKGGTCLKFLFGLHRFSEDIDFNVKKPVLFRKEIRTIMHDLMQLGIRNYFIKEEEFKDAYTCTIGFEGPMFTGAKQTQNKFRIDAGYRTGTFLKPTWTLMKSEYPETDANVLILTMDVEEILAERIIALTHRKKGRDLYDIWFLMNSGVQLDKSLLEKKRKRERVAINLKNIVTEAEYNRDMKRLTNRIIPYNQVKKDVMKFLA